MHISTLRRFLLLVSWLFTSFISRSQCFDDALKFTRAQQQFATLPNNIVSSLDSNFTIEAWIYPTSNLSFLQSESIFSFGNSSSDFMTLALFSGNNSPLFSISVNNQETDIISTAKVTINSWHQVAIVSNEGHATLYLDGNSVVTDTLDSFPNSLGGGAGTTDDWLGKSEVSPITFSGYMDEFRISDVARYLANYTPPSSPFTPDSNTYALYHFDDGSGQTITDASSRGENGVLGATSATESTDPSWQSCATLPIFLSQFGAVHENGYVHLQWTAYKDEMPGDFVVQRSIDGKNFSNIGTVPARESEGTFSYSFDDLMPLNGNNYYRLEINDQGSDSKYSNILLVTINRTPQFAVFPTVANSSVTVELPDAARLTIFDVKGAVVRQLNLTQSQVIDISALAKGFYFVVDHETGEVARFIKN